jgi:hypothetical protein
MKKILFVLLVVAGSCTPYRYLERHKGEICTECLEKYAKDSSSSTIDTVYIDSPVEVSDFWQELFLNCDSTGTVQLLNYSNYIDSIAKVRVKPTYIVKNNVLTINYKVWQDSIIMLKKTIKDIKIATPPPIKVDVVPLWVWIIFALLFIIIIIKFTR